MDNILLIDGNSILNRAFYATQNSFLKNAEGFATGALFGFLNIYLKQAEELRPEYAAVAFDVKAPTFRHERYEAYKAGRKGMPDELAAQLPVAKELIDAMGITAIELPGFEADDLLGTYGKACFGAGTLLLHSDRRPRCAAADRRNGTCAALLYAERTPADRGI